jgi:hypothetical protein
VAGVSLFRISVRPNRLPRLCSGSGLTAWSGSCRQRSTGLRRWSSVSVFGQPIAKLDRSLRRCHGNGGDPLDMTITCLDATDFVYPPPVPARCLTLSPCSASHSQARSTRRWGRNDEIDTVTRPTHRDSGSGGLSEVRADEGKNKGVSIYLLFSLHKRFKIMN